MAFKYSFCRIAPLTCYIRSYSSSRKCIDVTINDDSGIATVTMNQPPVNGLNMDLMSELVTLFPEMEQNKIKGMILTSALDKKVFSAGLDLRKVLKPDPEWLKVLWGTLQDLTINLYGTSYPTVAVINGHALAGGCLLAVGCDYRIMLNSFKIGLNETQVGVMVPPWLGLVMQNLIGNRKAELASTTSQLFTTKEALEVGLIDEIASDKSEAMEKAAKFFQQLEMINPAARALTKKYFRGPDIEMMHKVRQLDLETAVSLITGPETQKSIENQLEALKKKKKN